MDEFSFGDLLYIPGPPSSAHLDELGFGRGEEPVESVHQGESLLVRAGLVATQQSEHGHQHRVRQRPAPDAQKERKWRKDGYNVK